MLSATVNFNWFCQHSWKRSAKNTAVCLLGCSIGDNAVILFFQLFNFHLAMALVMMIAMLMGLVTSITLETILLSRQMLVKSAMQVAFGMSFISMLMMEAAANFTSILLVGGNRMLLTWGSIVPSWVIGYVSAWIYNYYKIKKYGKSCHG